MTVVLIRYILYFWNPPNIALEEEVEVGRQIVTTGGPEVWKKKAPYMPERERAWVEASGAQRLTTPRVILLIILLLGVLAVGVVAGPRLWVRLGVTLGVVCVTVLPLSLYTLVTARKRYHDWVDKMVATYVDAQKAVGNASGRRLPLDLAEVAKSFRKEADQGDPLGQLSLGLAYATGHGVPQDYVLAHVWLNLAAARGNGEAKNARERLTPLMTPDQIAEAQRLARDWKPTK